MPVLVNREADGTAKLVLGSDVGGLADGVVRGETAAAIVIVGFAVKLVRAGFGHHVDQTACGTAEFRRKPVGNHLKFLHCLERNCKILCLQRAKNFAEVIVEGVLAVNHHAQVIALLPAQADAATQAGHNLR